MYLFTKGINPINKHNNLSTENTTTHLFFLVLPSFNGRGPVYHSKIQQKDCFELKAISSVLLSLWKILWSRDWKEAIWLAVTVVFSTTCSVESSNLGGELPDLNPHCESQQEKSRRAERPTAVGVDGYHSQDTGRLMKAAQSWPASLTLAPHLPHTPLPLPKPLPNTFLLVPHFSKSFSPHLESSSLFLGLSFRSNLVNNVTYYPNYYVPPPKE